MPTLGSATQLLIAGTLLFCQAALAHAGRQGQALNRALDLILPLVPA